MSAHPVIEVRGLTKDYRGLRPLRVSELRVDLGERVGLAGFDAPAAEMLVTLLTGASLPDSGEIRVFGQQTSAIASEEEWLASLDRFGLVTHRAALLEGLTVAQNLALPFTIEIDPVPDEVWPRVRNLASEVGLDESALGSPLARVAAVDRFRVQVARALAAEPSLLVLEHPTAHVPREHVATVGRMVRAVTEHRRLTLLAVSQDEEFSRATCTRRLELTPATGALSAVGGWRRWFQR